ESLVLTLTCNPSTGRIFGTYQINDGPVQSMGSEVTLTGAAKSAFFSSTSRAGIMASHKNNLGAFTATFSRFAVQPLSTGTPSPSGDQPSILAVRPANGATNVPRDAFVAADVFLPTAGAGVDGASMSSDSVRLVRASDGAIVPATLNTSGGGDSVVLQPLTPLAANTVYRFIVTAGLKDVTGASFVPFESTFTTGSNITATDQHIAFEKIRLPQAEGRLFSSVLVGPDGRLYATTLTGEICRWEIDTATGRLGEIDIIETVIEANGGNRFITGLAFDPSSTRDNLIAWITHSDYAFENARDFSGAISRLTGPDLSGYRDMVVGLPRSIRDHLTNQPVFGPDGALYFGQGAMSAMGAADPTWGNRDETLLSAAVLRLDVRAVVNRRAAGLGPLNVRTGRAGAYDPFAPAAPLTIYATGVRNAYDLLFHSSGRLFAPGNGSGAGGNTPAGPGVPGLTRVNTTQNDYLFDIVPGGYYGHPNPTRGEYVLNGGNPTSGPDPEEVTQYPVGTRPDSKYRRPAFTFGKSFSPNGVLEYQSNSFRGRLKGRILVARYSGGDDIMVLNTDRSGNVTALQSEIVGLSQFVDPLDLAEDLRTGCLYVVEFGAERITLVRPVTPGPNLAVDSTRLLFNDVRGDGKATVATLTLRNAGTVPLTLPSNAFTITGGARSRFSLVDAPSLPRVL
ncbi:MAG: PQQ-dependent sugar dehydrogenase, partial [Phycisphaerae bacterium]|nr:PQQ-dependent sugar dehydrogenase [Phycisphaerae bacterium]